MLGKIPQGQRVVHLAERPSEHAGADQGPRQTFTSLSHGAQEDEPRSAQQDHQMDVLVEEAVAADSDSENHVHLIEGQPPG